MNNKLPVVRSKVPSIATLSHRFHGLFEDEAWHGGNASSLSMEVTQKTICQEISPELSSGFRGIVPTLNTATFPHFPELPFEIREQIWEHALPDHQNVVVIGGPLGWNRSHSRNRPYSWNREEPYGRTVVSYRPPAVLHTCRHSRTVGLKSYPRCFTEQLGTPILFNLSKDLLLFSDDHSFQRFLKISFNTYGNNVFGLPADLRFLGICGHIRCEPAHYETTHSRLYLFDRLEELILENLTSISNEEMDLPFIEDLREVWTARKMKAAKKLKGSISKQDLELPKISFFSLEEIKRMARPDRLLAGDALLWAAQGSTITQLARVEM